MSSIPTKQIDGDVAVGRNVSVGGDANIQGDVRVGHNLRVEGWLDARNIKTPAKGIFLTDAKLREAYPYPHPGWWALVGESLPALLYVSDEGEWVSTGRTVGNLVVDGSGMADALDEFRGELATLAGRVDTNTSGVSALEGKFNEVRSRVEGAKEVADAAQETMDRIMRDAGNPGGFATLDSNSKIAASYLPGYVDDVVEFAAILSARPECSEAASALRSEDGRCSVLYEESSMRLLLKYEPETTDVELQTEAAGGGENAFTPVGQTTYHTDWADGEVFGEATEIGRRPVSGKIYLCLDNGIAYRWGGKKSGLVALGGGTCGCISMTEEDVDNLIGSGETTPPADDEIPEYAMSFDEIDAAIDAVPLL